MIQCFIFQYSIEPLICNTFILFMFNKYINKYLLISVNILVITSFFHTCHCTLGLAPVYLEENLGIGIGIGNRE